MHVYHTVMSKNLNKVLLCNPFKLTRIVQNTLSNVSLKFLPLYTNLPGTITELYSSDGRGVKIYHTCILKYSSMKACYVLPSSYFELFRLLQQCLLMIAAQLCKLVRNMD